MDTCSLSKFALLSREHCNFGLALQGKNDGKKKKPCFPNLAAMVTIGCVLVCLCVTKYFAEMLEILYKLS